MVPAAVVMLCGAPPNRKPTFKAGRSSHGKPTFKVTKNKVTLKVGLQCRPTFKVIFLVTLKVGLKKSF